MVLKCKTLYVILRGATDLKDIRHGLPKMKPKMRVYAVGSISEGTSNSKNYRTPADKEGEINPIWNYPMQFTIKESAAEQTLMFKLWCDRTVGDKIIGEVCVPIKELLAIMGEEDSVDVSCPVKSSSGELQFLYSFHPITDPPPPLPPRRNYILKTVAGFVLNVAVHAAAWFAFS